MHVKYIIAIPLNGIAILQFNLQKAEVSEND